MMIWTTMTAACQMRVLGGWECNEGTGFPGPFARHCGGAVDGAGGDEAADHEPPLVEVDHCSTDCGRLLRE